MNFMRRLVVGVALVLLATSCSGSEPGSEEDLAGQIDALDVPSALVELGDTYDAECPGNCPLYVRWHDATVAPDIARTELQSRMEAAGVEVNEASAGPTLFAASNDTHIFFVVLDTAMLSDNELAPAGTEVEISVQLLPDA
jgi:hypothetical protein